jgi:hypothetical protein
VRTRLLAAACVLVGLTAPASADAATVVGKAPGKPVTLAGKPVDRVRAVNPATAAPVAFSRFGRKASYRLVVPGGAYLVLAPIRGKGGRTVIARSRIFRIRAGQRKRVSTTKKTPTRKQLRRKRKRRRPRGRAAAGELIKISVHGSTVSGAGLEYLGRSVDSMTITDLFPAREGLPCQVEVYEDRLSDGFKAIQQEIRLQQSPLVDPRTRVTPLYNTERYTPTVRVAANLQVSGNSMTGSVAATEIATGKTLASQPVSRDLGTFLDGFASELRQLLGKLCESGPPPAFTGSVSGTASYDNAELGAGNQLNANWSGTLRLVQAPSPYPPGIPGAPTANYSLASGSINYSFSGRVGDCDVAGSGPIDLAAQPDLAFAQPLQLFDGEPRIYQYVIPHPLTAQVMGTTSNCDEPSENGDDFPWSPAAGIPWIVNAPLPGGPVGADWSISGSGSGNGGPGTPDQTWQWALTPSS